MSLFSVSVILSPPLLLCLSFVFSCLYVILSKNYYVILFKNITFAGIMVEVKSRNRFSVQSLLHVWKA